MGLQIIESYNQSSLSFEETNHRSTVSINVDRAHLGSPTTPLSSVADPFHFNMDPDPFREITDPNLT